MKNLAQVWGRKSRVDNEYPVVDWPDNKQYIGIEIEAERTRGRTSNVVFPENISPYWNRISDGSLQNGAEFVLAGPMRGANLSAAIHQFFSEPTRLMPATTSGTHIHIDMMEDGTNVTSIQSLILMVYIIEPAIFRMIDPAREWCGFTNSLETAPTEFLNLALRDGIEDNPEPLQLLCESNRQYKYYGLNVQPLGSYGSVEFRYFPTATSAAQLIEWVRLVQLIKMAAIQLSNKAGVLRWLETQESYESFLRNHLGEWGERILQYVPYDEATRRHGKAMLTLDASVGGQSVVFDESFLSHKRYAKLTKKRRTRRKAGMALDYPFTFKYGAVTGTHNTLLYYNHQVYYHTSNRSDPWQSVCFYDQYNQNIWRRSGSLDNGSIPTEVWEAILRNRFAVVANLTAAKEEYTASGRSEYDAIEGTLDALLVFFNQQAVDRGMDIEAPSSPPPQRARRNTILVEESYAPVTTETYENLVSGTDYTRPRTGEWVTRTRPSPGRVTVTDSQPQSPDSVWEDDPFTEEGEE